jgi:hypothetical protein
MVGVLIAAPRLLKQNNIAALLDDAVNCNLSSFNRGSTPGTSNCYGTSGAAQGAAVHERPSVVSGQALRASADVAAQAAAVVTLSACLTEGESHEGRREGGQLLLMVVGDKNLQTERRTLDQHVGGLYGFCRRLNSCWHMCRTAAAGTACACSYQQAELRCVLQSTCMVATVNAHRLK